MSTRRHTSGKYEIAKPLCSQVQRVRMGSFRYSSQVLHGFVKETKSIPGKKLVFKDIKNTEGKTVGKEARVALEYNTGRVALVEWIVKASQLNDPSTYHSVLLVDYQRIRGVDYSPIKRTKFFKTHIPKGWHENVIDPNTRENRHEPVNVGTISDFEDFCQKIAKLWNIDYQPEGRLL